MGLTSKVDINFFNQTSINYGWGKIQPQSQYQKDNKDISNLTLKRYYAIILS